MSRDILKYEKCLYEIKERFDIIYDNLTGARSNEIHFTKIESICLQFRKVIELIVFSSLIANKEEYSRQYEKFAKNWNIKLIIKDLERINPEFYPIPTEQVFMHMEDGLPVYDTPPIQNGFLTKIELIEIYNKCGGILHAENPYGHKRDLKKLFQEFPIWIEKIAKLLNHHNLTLVDKETIIVGQMMGEDGLPHATEFKAS